MNKQELAQTIRDRFTPLGFMCECKGTHSDCQLTQQNPAQWAQFETVQRIAEFIERES
jgi:hypothetical protein